MSETVKPNPLGVEPVGKLILKFAVPSTIALIINALYNIVDQIFIGNIVGYLGNAATNIIFPLTVFSIAIPSLLGEGCAAYFSLQLGKGNREKGSRGICNTLLLITVISISILTLCELFMTQLCKLFGASSETLPYAASYGRIIVIVFLVFFIPFCYSYRTMAELLLSFSLLYHWPSQCLPLAGQMAVPDTQWSACLQEPLSISF